MKLVYKKYINITKLLNLELGIIVIRTMVWLSCISTWLLPYFW